MSTQLSKTDSEVSSLTPSSPTRSSPRLPVYYVQSPSRDSHDGGKTTNSFQSSPAALSPEGSPPHSSHSNSSLGPPSRKSSSTRFSGSLKPIWKGSRKGRGTKAWKDDRFDAIEEEGLLDEEDENKGLIPRGCYFMVFVVGFCVLFSFFALILWGASRNQKPSITVQVNFITSPHMYNYSSHISSMYQFFNVLIILTTCYDLFIHFNTLLRKLKKREQEKKKIFFSQYIYILEQLICCVIY